MAPARLFYFLLLATALALAVVWQNAALRQAGRRLEALRSEVAGQRAEQLIYRAHLSKLRNPQRIVRLVQWLGLDLSERQVPPVPEPSRQLPTTARKAAADAGLSTPPSTAAQPATARRTPLAAVTRSAQDTAAATRGKP